MTLATSNNLANGIYLKGMKNCSFHMPTGQSGMADYRTSCINSLVRRSSVNISGTSEIEWIEN